MSGTEAEALECLRRFPLSPEATTQLFAGGQGRTRLLKTCLCSGIEAMQCAVRLTGRSRPLLARGYTRYAPPAPAGAPKRTLYLRSMEGYTAVAFVAAGLGAIWLGRRSRSSDAASGAGGSTADSSATLGDASLDVKSYTPKAMTTADDVQLLLRLGRSREVYAVPVVISLSSWVTDASQTVLQCIDAVLSAASVGDGSVGLVAVRSDTWRGIAAGDAFLAQPESHPRDAPLLVDPSTPHLAVVFVGESEEAAIASSVAGKDAVRGILGWLGLGACEVGSAGRAGGETLAGIVGRAGTACACAEAPAGASAGLRSALLGGLVVSHGQEAAVRLPGQGGEVLLQCPLVVPNQRQLSRALQLLSE